MTSKFISEDFCNKQQISTKSPGPPEGQRGDSFDKLLPQPFSTTPASQSTRLESADNSLEHNQASTWAQPTSGFSDNQNCLPISVQSAPRLIPEQPTQDASSCVPDGAHAPTPVGARSCVRQEDILLPVLSDKLIFNGSCIQPSTSRNVQFSTRENMLFRGREDTQSSALTNTKTGFDRPSLPSNSGYGGFKELQVPPQAKTVAAGSDGRGSTALDWIVPVEDSCQTNRTMTVSERLRPTLLKAHADRNRSAIKARMAGWTLNVAIFLQVILGSLTTGVAAGATNEKQAAIGTTILGALSTIVASFLARARGSGEPEASITRVKDLEQYIREVDAFMMDHGHSTSSEHDIQLHKFRMRFEELLGNMTHKSARKPPESGASQV